LGLDGGVMTRRRIRQLFGERHLVLITLLQLAKPHA
jgi:hypothetical protein